MSTLREAAEKALKALGVATTPFPTDQQEVRSAMDALRAELVKPDAPTVEDEPAPQMPEALRDSLQRRCVEWGVYWRAPDAHGVDLTHEQALELLRDALGVEVEIAAAPRPAPAEPQPERDFAAEVDHWMKRSKEWRKRAEAAESAVSEFHHAIKDAGWHPGRTDDSLPDIIRAKGAELRAAPAPQPAGGERERYEFVLAQCREAQDIAASRGWALNDIATASTTDPRARKIATEALLSALSQPAAQQPAQDLVGLLREWEKLRDPVTLHVSLLRGFPAKLDRDTFLHLAGEPAAQQEPLTVDYSGCDICAREGAGRKPSDPRLVRVAVPLRLPRWLVEWIDQQDGTRADVIEAAILKAHKLRQPGATHQK